MLPSAWAVNKKCLACDKYQGRRKKERLKELRCRFTNFSIPQSSAHVNEFLRLIDFVLSSVGARSKGGKSKIDE
jgi:hypothetical protein